MSLHGLIVSAGWRACVESASHGRADDVALLAELSSGRRQARMWTTCQYRQSMLDADRCATPAMKRTRPRSLGCIVAEYQVLGGSVLVITCWLCGGSVRADGLARRGSMSRPPCR